MRFNKKLISESLSHLGNGKKVFTNGKKQNVILSEEQLDRLLLQLKESKEKTISLIIKESHGLIRKAIVSEGLKLNIKDYSDTLIGEGFDTGGYNRGVAAGEGLENVINGIKKAYDMIKDSDTRKKLANSITKLGNFMTITADAIASGRDQRAMKNPDSLKDPLPYPELDEEMEEQTTAASAGAYSAPLEFTEGKKKDHDGDGDIDSDDYLAAKDKAIKKAMKEDSGHDEAMNYGRDEGHDDKELYDLKHDGGSEEHIKDLEDDMHYDHIHDSENIEESQEEKERLIQEDIKKMKQIIKPISKI